MQASLASKGDWQGLMKYNNQAAKSRPAPQQAAVAVAEPSDDLTQLNGIGPRIASILNDGGITSYNQLQHANTGELRQIIATGGALPPVEPRILAHPGHVRGQGRLVRARRLQQALTSASGRGSGDGAASRLADLRIPLLQRICAPVPRGAGVFVGAGRTARVHARKGDRCRDSRPRASPLPTTSG